MSTENQVGYNKEMPTCPNCGRPRLDGAIECPGCGIIYAKANNPSSSPPQPNQAQERKENRIESIKSLPLAIGLNLLLPGLGYIYMGRWIVGVLAAIVIPTLFFTTGLLFILPTWIGVNVIMGIDMLILSNKNRKQVEAASMKKCPFCAEMIRTEARLCRFCGTKFDMDTPQAQALPTPKSTKSMSIAAPRISAVLAILIAVVVIWYFLGGGLNKQAATNLQNIHNQVANDTVRQYEIAKRNGSPIDVCVQAGFVTAAYLQAKDEANYQRWKQTEKADCERAGLPK